MLYPPLLHCGHRVGALQFLAKQQSQVGTSRLWEGRYSKSEQCQVQTAKVEARSGSRHKSSRLALASESPGSSPALSDPNVSGSARKTDLWRNAHLLDAVHGLCSALG